MPDGGPVPRGSGVAGCVRAGPLCTEPDLSEERRGSPRGGSMGTLELEQMKLRS